MIKHLKLLIVLLCCSCATSTLQPGDFPGTDAQERCMEIANYNCLASEKCRGIPHNVCMMLAYSQMCVRVKKVGPGYHDCLLYFKRYKCGETKVDKACSKAFLGEIDNE